MSSMKDWDVQYDSTFLAAGGAAEEEASQLSGDTAETYSGL